MTTTQIYNIIKTWINTILNTSGTSIGNCTWTNGSKEITGTGFVTNGIVQNNGFVKRTSDNIDFYSKIQSFTNTKITLFNNYLGTSGSNKAGEYKLEFIPIIRGEQSAPAPKKEYMVIHQPMSVVQVSSGNFERRVETVDHVTSMYMDYAIHYQATISIEEVGFADNGDKLRLLLNSLRRQDIKDYFRNSKISILRNEGINPIPDVSENIWTLRTNMDLIVLFPDEGTFDSNYISTVEITTNYEDVREDGSLIIEEE